MPRHLHYAFPHRQGTTPYAYTVLRKLNTGQPYDITVKLVLPTSTSNYDIGKRDSSDDIVLPCRLTTGLSYYPPLQATS